jgi:protein-disulfide isomerase
MLRPFRFRVLEVSLFGFVLFACAACKDSSLPVDRSREVIRELSDSTPVLKDPGGVIKVGDIRERVRPELEQLRDRVAEIYRNQARILARERLLEKKAKEKGFDSVRAFQEHAQAELTVDQKTVTKFIKDSHLKGLSRGQVETFLKEQLRQEMATQDNLTLSRQLQWKLARASHELPVSNPILSKGAEKPTAVIHEYCDLSLPACISAHRRIEGVFLRHSKSVLWVFHPLVFPQNQKEEAIELSLAAFCAARNSKFWPFVDRAFSSYSDVASSKKFDATKELVKLGIDEKLVSACIHDGVSQRQITEEILSARKVGVAEVPAFFLDGARYSTPEEIESEIASL